MKLQEALDHALTTAKRLKEREVKKARGRDNHMLMPTLILYRGDRQVAIIGLPMNRDKFLRALEIFGSGLEPDVMVFVNEAWYTHVPITPGGSLKDDYPTGTLQRLVDEENALETGRVSDCIQLAAANRAGDVKLTSQLMRVISHRLVEWGELIDANFGEPGGAIPDVMRHAMSLSFSSRARTTFPILDMLREHMSPEEKTAQQDAIVIKFAYEQLGRMVVMLDLGAPGSERATYLRKSLAGRVASL